LNLAKEKRVVSERLEDDPKKIKCFRCQDYGHHQKDCSHEPICYKCKEEGHMAAECYEFHTKAGELKMYGFALQEQGFYIIRIRGEEEYQRAASIFQVLHEVATEGKLEEELKNLISSKWNWQVK
jgi:hypothetical protein